MNVTPSLYALSLYNNACNEILEERTALRRRMLQLIANLALELHITESIKETEVCERCDGRGVIEGYMQWSYTAGYASNASYPCPDCCTIEDSLDDIEF